VHDRDGNRRDRDTSRQPDSKEAAPKRLQSMHHPRFSPPSTRTQTDYVADHKRKLAVVSGFYGEGDEPFIACDKLL
jgi:hypothetical protein